MRSTCYFQEFQEIRLEHIKKHHSIWIAAVSYFTPWLQIYEYIKEILWTGHSLMLDLSGTGSERWKFLRIEQNNTQICEIIIKFSNNASSDTFCVRNFEWVYPVIVAVAASTFFQFLFSFVFCVNSPHISHSYSHSSVCNAYCAYSTNAPHSKTDDTMRKEEQ